jgi:diguanylate cyclase (GGDEF)-like protein/PAS domain S-box-containing protein
MLAGSLHSLQLVEQTKFSEEYLHAVLKASQDIAIVSTDRNGYIITCSEGTERIFGSQPIDLRGRDILTLYTDESLIRGLHEFLANPDSEEIFKKEITELRRGEHPLFLNLRFQKVRNYRGNVIGFLGITRDITETMKLEGRLRELSVTDELTGLYNQREFFNLLDREVEKYKRNHRALSLCFIDLDKFKQFNDKQGHLEGDQVLKKVAEFMRKSIRHHLDLAFRYGGDEFAIIMSEVQPEKGRVMAERIRMAVQDYFRGDITLSIGIAGYNSRLNSQQLVELADKAMYHAKTRGGNRITLD